MSKLHVFPVMVPCEGLSRQLYQPFLSHLSALMMEQKLRRNTEFGLFFERLYTLSQFFRFLSVTASMTCINGIHIPLIWKRHDICYLAYHMVASGHQSRSWERCFIDGVVIYMAKMSMCTHDSRVTLGIIFQTGRSAPYCQVVTTGKWGMRQRRLFWHVRSSKPNKACCGLRTEGRYVMW